MTTPETPHDYQPRDEVADAIAGVLWACESGCVTHGDGARLAADAAIAAARPHIIAELDVENMSYDALLNEAWEHEWVVSFETRGMDGERGWDVSIVNYVTNRRIGYVQAECVGNTPLEALRAAVRTARDFDKPVWFDNGKPYGVWLYPGDEGYTDAVAQIVGAVDEAIREGEAA